MRGILKIFGINIIVLYLVTQWFSGLSIANGWQGLIVAGVGLTLVNLLARPIINLLLLPINLITFGFFMWVSAAFSLYLTTLVVTGFE
ncbi:phage holin family protein, partial [Candidatus Woesebacteria bacterium]|nr:phage holin family protein [Candidatus Woesebacteria bacterium]